MNKLRIRTVADRAGGLFQPLRADWSSMFWEPGSTEASSGGTCKVQNCTTTYTGPMGVECCCAYVCPSGVSWVCRQGSYCAA